MMNKLKTFRKIDKRNLLYGSYTYQVRPGRMRDTDYWQVRNWCENKWGPPEAWKHQGNLSWREYNFHWRVVHPGGRKTPLIYLKGEAEAMLFGLVWAAS